MKMALCIFIMGNLTETKSAWGSLLHTARPELDLIIIDNAPNCGDNQVDFFQRFIVPFWPGVVDYRPQDDNLGVVKSMQYCYEVFSEYDIYAFLHNDVVVYEPWNKMVELIFETHEDAGLVGFFGAEGIHHSSGRFNVLNNMLEAEIHGGRMTDGYKEVAVLDGLCMIASRKMLDVRGGVDTSFDIHHFYDLDLSLESIDRGFRNFVLPIKCHHQSGKTACQPIFQEWANKYVGVEKEGEATLYEMNRQRWIKKWAHRFAPHDGWKVGMQWNRQ